MDRLFLLGVLLSAFATEAKGQTVPEPHELASPAVSGGASAQAEADPDPGLTMVPARCFNTDRQEVPTANVTVLHNKTVTFPMNGLTLRSEIHGATVTVKYSNEPEWTAIFEILTIVNYNTSDARVYHGTLAGRPILAWEETVENHARRAGIVEYRGRGLFPVCEGVIRTPEELQRFRRQR